ncbi:MAG TPA: ATP-binding protein [Bryobacteraceae bacterium]|nr:ATP-binding protein [Bryobacteraceae bacterium]
MPTRLSVFGLKIQESPTERKRILAGTAFLVLLLVLLEWRFHLDVSLGIFYAIPVALAGLVLNRTQVVLLSLFCAFVRGQFISMDLSQLEIALRFVMATIAYAGAGLLLVEISNNRRRLVEHYARLDLEQRLRRKAEEQLRILVESSPAAILTLDANANVAAANRAAHEMFGFDPGSLTGESITPYFPVFQRALEFSPGGRPVRSSVSGWARRKEGAGFPVQAWFSTYGTGVEHALAAILVDMSEEVRDREMENFRHLVDHHRLLAGAVSHEIRNLCSAASVVCTNLGRNVDLSASADFDALRKLIAGLTQIASVELRQEKVIAPPTSPREIMDQLQVVVEPDWTEIDGQILVDFPETTPAVLADPHGLMQIFLNLSQNSCRILENQEERILRISAMPMGEQVVIRFQDTGPGVQDPSVLFHPFRPEADGTGLGLYVSRALARSFGGDLVHVPTAKGCRFDLTLLAGSGRG